MKLLLSKCGVGMALLVSVAAAPFSGSDLARPTEEAIARSGAFSAAMLDNSKSRWAREGRVGLIDATAVVVLAASPVGEPPPGETVGGATECPVVSTQCPPMITSCPQITTQCPVVETVCKTTECPVSSTLCPLTPTSCPVDPTVCEATRCTRPSCWDPPPVCGITFDAGPPARFVAPDTVVPGFACDAAQVGLRGTMTPTITFLPAIGG